tara:strand:+ start:531 stop:1058 length:528 start_codon:yes stop_codon:yes gene_type:complete
MKPDNKVLATLLSMLLVSCAEKNFSDLDAFIENSNLVRIEKIEPLPTIRNYRAFAYRAAQVRSPFSLPPDPNGISRQPPVLSDPPDKSRKREFLEQFPLESLTMVGSLNRSGKIWCLVQDPLGRVHRISNGSFLGLNHGKVISAGEISMRLIEIVTDGTNHGWIERPRSLHLNSF